MNLKLAGGAEAEVSLVPGNSRPTEGITMTPRCLVAALLVACVAVLPAPAHADEPITLEAAHAIGVDAYLYLYPLVTMDITQKQSVNIELQGQAALTLGQGTRACDGED
jgi:hypothetical protein